MKNGERQAILVMVALVIGIVGMTLVAEVSAKLMVGIVLMIWSDNIFKNL